MPLKQTGRLHAPAEMHFRYVGTKIGSTWHGWIAGPPQWYWCHTMHRTKPCLKELTDGQVECALCGQARAPQNVGYLGVYREVDAKPVLVVLHDEQMERADQLRLHERVLIGREDNAADGVWVSPALKPQPAYHTTLKERMVACDLTNTLLKLWALPELTAWYRKGEQPAASKKYVPKPGQYKHPKGTPDRREEVNRGFAAACKRAPSPAPLPDSIEEIMPAALAKASKNGTH